MTSNDWLMVFSQSRLYGGLYLGDQLEANRRIWPKDTWLQKRLAELREKENDGNLSRS